MTLRRQPYTECRLFIDGARGLKVGDYLQTPGGSAYWVTAMRQSQKRPQRRHLTCLRWPLDEIPAGAKVFDLRWYSRNKKARRLS